MRRVPRVVILSAVLALGPMLAACENMDLDSLDVFGLGNKKKLPGKRELVFPNGVPGVSQGVPQEYLQANQPPPETAQTPLPGDGQNTQTANVRGTPNLPPQQTANVQAGTVAPRRAGSNAPQQIVPEIERKTAAVEPAHRAKPKPKPHVAKKKEPPKPKAQAKADTKANTKTEAKGQSPWPGQQQQPAGPWPSQQQAQSPWPAQQQKAAEPWPGTTQNTASPWPGTPASGTVAR
jgi:hypothetical protein